MIGIGIDAVDIDRFRAILQRSPRMLQRIFTEQEIEYGGRFTDSAPRLAARFAAKEAAMKALGVGLGAFSFKEVEVQILRGGAPMLLLSGAAERLAKSKGVTAWHISLTHTDSSAQAVVAAL